MLPRRVMRGLALPTGTPSTVQGDAGHGKSGSHNVAWQGTSGQHAPAVVVGLAKRHGGHAGPLKAEAEAANAAEKVQHIHSALTVTVAPVIRRPRLA